MTKKKQSDKSNVRGTHAQHKIDSLTSNQFSKLKQLRSHGHDNDQLSSWKLAIYGWNVDHAAQYYQKDSFCHQFCVEMVCTPSAFERAKIKGKQDAEKRDKLRKIEEKNAENAAKLNQRKSVTQSPQSALKRMLSNRDTDQESTQSETFDISKSESTKQDLSETEKL